MNGFFVPVSGWFVMLLVVALFAHAALLPLFIAFLIDVTAGSACIKLLKVFVGRTAHNVR